jgi:hypothetical protein
MYGAFAIRIVSSKKSWAARRIYALESAVLASASASDRNEHTFRRRTRWLTSSDEHSNPYRVD